MRTEIKYEWCREITDEYGDIINSDFCDILEPIKDAEGDLVLVRNEGNENEGVTGRFWAYVKGGKLPELFSDATGENVNIKVPVKFHK